MAYINIFSLSINSINNYIYQWAVSQRDYPSMTNFEVGQILSRIDGWYISDKNKKHNNWHFAPNPSRGVGLQRGKGDATVKWGLIEIIRNIMNLDRDQFLKVIKQARKKRVNLDTFFQEPEEPEEPEEEEIKKDESWKTQDWFKQYVEKPLEQSVF